MWYPNPVLLPIKGGGGEEEEEEEEEEFGLPFGIALNSVLIAQRFHPCSSHT